MGIPTIKFSMPYRRSSVVQSQVQLADPETNMTIFTFCGDVSFKIGRLLLKAEVRPIFPPMDKLATWHIFFFIFWEHGAVLHMRIYYPLMVPSNKSFDVWTCLCRLIIIEKTSILPMSAHFTEDISHV